MKLSLSTWSKISFILFVVLAIFYLVFIYSYGQLTSGDYYFVFSKTWLFLIPIIILLLCSIIFYIIHVIKSNKWLS